MTALIGGDVVNTDCTVLFLAKEGDVLASQAGAYVRTHIPNACVILLGKKDSVPSGTGHFDYLVSYLCPKVIPASMLARVRKASINFHPGPPEYPGIGCTNFALYDGVSEYGVTCHHMLPKVDSGAIIKVDRFPVREADSVFSLTQRCYAHIAYMFYDIMDALLNGRPLPSSSEMWKRAPYTRVEFEGLFRLTRDMSEGEIRRRLRATTFPGFPAASFGDGSVVS